MDPDAWRVASIAHYLAHTGAYVVSRFPGFPVHEYLTSLLIHGGPVATNLASALFSAFAVFFFLLILRKLGCRDAWLAGLALACIPIVFITSTVTLDAQWALALLLAATYLALQRHPWLTGICLGLATGCRISSVILVIPLCMVIYYQIRQQEAAAGAADEAAREEVEEVKPVQATPVNVPLEAALTEEPGSEEFEAEEAEEEEQPMDPAQRAVLITVLVTLAASVICFFPLVQHYGFAFFRFNNDPPPLYVQMRHFTTDTWGVLGCLALLLALASQLLPALRRGDRTFPVPPERPMRLAWIVALVETVLLFIYLPHQAMYLIPCLPFALLLLGYLLPRRIFQAFCVALIISPFCFTLRSPLYPPGPGTPPFRLMGQTFRVYSSGPILDDHHQRQEQRRFLLRTFAFAESQRSRSWLIVLGYWPELNMVALEHGFVMLPYNANALYRQGNDLENNFITRDQALTVVMTSVMTREMFKVCLQHKDIAIYFLPGEPGWPGADKVMQDMYDIDIVRAGAKPLHSPFN